MKAIFLCTSGGYKFTETLLERYVTTPLQIETWQIKLINMTISLGEEWQKKISSITREIDTADAIVIFATEDYRENSWGLSELAYILSSKPQNKMAVLSILVDDTSIPVELSAYNCAKVSNSKEGQDAAIENINLMLNGMFGMAVKEVAEKEREKREQSRETIKKIAKSFSSILPVLTTAVLPVLLNSFRLDSTLIFAVVVLVIAVVSFIFLLRSSNANKRAKEKEVEEFSRKIRKDEPQITYNIFGDGSKVIFPDATDSKDGGSAKYDPLNLLNVSLEEMKKYYEISRTQARSSFILAIVMCVLGFLLLTGAVLIPLVSDAGIEVSIISVVGGSFVELFAGTTMLVYRSAVNQLSNYYNAIHQNERYLSCVNLLDRLSTTERQDIMVEEIIREEIKKSPVISVVREKEDIKKKEDKAQ